MNLDDYLKEDTLIGETIEEKPQNENKEEIKTGGTKAGVSGSNYNLTQFRNVILNDYNGGDDILSITQDSSYDNSSYMRIIILSKDSKEINCQVSRNGMVYQNNETIQNLTYNKYLMFNASDDCIGLYYYKYDNGIGFFEVIPKTGQSIGGGSSGEQIDYTEYLEEIITRIEGVEDGIQDINDNLISIGNGSGNNNNSQVGSVSQNVISTPLRDYNLTDQIIVIELCIGLFIGLIYVLKRTVFKWK